MKYVHLYYMGVCRVVCAFVYAQMCVWEVICWKNTLSRSCSSYLSLSFGTLKCGLLHWSLQSLYGVIKLCHCSHLTGRLADLISCRKVKFTETWVLFMWLWPFISIHQCNELPRADEQTHKQANGLARLSKPLYFNCQHTWNVKTNKLVCVMDVYIFLGDYFMGCLFFFPPNKFV